MAKDNRKVVIFTAPSGSGKSTVVNHILKLHPELEFSISAASRAPRGTEQNGVEYYFMTADEFRRRIAADEFVEYEEVYAGSYYGTLKSEVERIWNKGNAIIFDVDVKGGVSLKKYFGDRALSIFIQAPSVQVLRERLVGRGTDSAEAIERRESGILEAGNIHSLVQLESGRDRLAYHNLAAVYGEFKEYVVVRNRSGG